MSEGEGSGSTATRNVLLAGSGCGCLMSPVVILGMVVVIIIIGGFGVILAPLIALILLFGGGGGGGAGEGDADAVIAIFEGDGKGELDPDSIPDQDLVDPIEEAGKLCEAIGPTVIAAQIELASNFDAAKVGPDGRLGISQLPPAVFTQYGKDDDDNDKTSALDAEDSIMAQGRYLCEMANQSQQLLDSGQATGKLLDLALVGYDQGMDAVRTAHGVPQTNAAQGYVVQVRALLAKYEGVATPPPSDTPSPSVTPSDENQ